MALIKSQRFVRSFQHWIIIIRDASLILGIPYLIVLQRELNNQQVASLKAINESQVSQIQLLRETQYDRALSLLKSQKEVYEIELGMFSNKLQVLQTSVSATSNQVLQLREIIAKKEQIIEAFNTTQSALQNWRDQSGSGLTVLADSSTQIAIYWNASSYAGSSRLAGYRIYRDGVLRAITIANSYVDSGLSPARQYCYFVRAYDSAGNESSPSGTACVSTPSVPAR
jgi:hypothetical protein